MEKDLIKACRPWGKKILARHWPEKGNKAGGINRHGVPCAVEKAQVFSGWKSRLATLAPASSNRSGCGGNEAAEAFDGEWREARHGEPTGREHYGVEQLRNVSSPQQNTPDLPARTGLPFSGLHTPEPGALRATKPRQGTIADSPGARSRPICSCTRRDMGYFLYPFVSPRGRASYSHTRAQAPETSACETGLTLAEGHSSICWIGICPRPGLLFQTVMHESDASRLYRCVCVGVFSPVHTLFAERAGGHVLEYDAGTQDEGGA